MGTSKSGYTSSLSGPELLAAMEIGTRVVRGADWCYGDEDGPAPGEGTVAQIRQDGWVVVQWDTGKQHHYRMGVIQKYDLNLVDKLPEQQQDSASDYVEQNESVCTSPLSDPELAAAMKIGTRVVRGADWDWGDEDGPAPGEGTVDHIRQDGWVGVQWDTGNVFCYRMGFHGKYDLKLADKLSEQQQESASDSVEKNGNDEKEENIPENQVSEIIPEAKGVDRLVQDLKRLLLS